MTALIAARALTTASTNVASRTRLAPHSAVRELEPTEQLRPPSWATNSDRPLRMVLGRDFGQIPVHSRSISQASAVIGGTVIQGVRAGSTDAGVDPPLVAAPSASPVAAPSASPVAASTPVPAASIAAAPSGAIAWKQLLRFPHDALWFFCGEHPSGFSTNTRLEASGFTDPTALRWSVATGADKVNIRGAPSGPTIVLDSKEGSTREDDIAVEVREGPTAETRFVGHLTVRKPRRLIQRGPLDNAGCPPGVAGCGPGCGAYWTDYDYRVVDNVGGTVVGATVNENFPGPNWNDQANNWKVPHADVWPETDGTFTDTWAVWCGAPMPVAPGAPTAGQSVDRLVQEFYIGGNAPGKGCRVQHHTAHRYLGFARHEAISEG
jgi:hypothetical protein